MEKYLNKFYDFIDKIGKHNFILIIFVFIVILVTSLFQTFSLYTESEGLSILNGKDTYSFILRNNEDGNSVAVAPNSSKNVDITIRNDSEIDLLYGLYSSIDPEEHEDVFFGDSPLSEHSSDGTIPGKTSYVVTIKIYNYSSEEKIIDFGLKFGFVNSGELFLEENQYWVESLYIMKNLYSIWNGDYNYYRADEYRNNIVSASFVDLDLISDEISPANAVVSWNASAYGENDDSVVAWLIENTTYVGSADIYYDLYIGSKEKIYTQSLYALFSQMSALENVSFNNLDTSLAKDMAFLFRECSNLKGNIYGANGWEMDLRAFDTSNVTSMWSLFGGCANITSVNLEGFDTSNVTDMQMMFQNCKSLTSLDLKNWDTSNVTNMQFMFDVCINLESLELGKDFVTTNVENFYKMFYYCVHLNTSILITTSSSISPNYSKMFEAAATESGAQIDVYFTTSTQQLVNNMVNTKSSASKVYARASEYMAPGIKLAEAPVGSYIKYVGDNGCDNTNIVNGYTSCSGKNARYESDSNKGWCVVETGKYMFNGWRIGYVSEGSAYLISAGATECLCTNSNETTSDTSCSSYFDANNLYKHFNNIDNIALKYCNKNYAKGGVCNDTTAWAMNADDFENITGSTLSSTSCFQVSSTECGYNNTLINNGGFYWFATATDQAGKGHGAFIWNPGYNSVQIFNSSSPEGVRPVLALDSSVYITGGTGTYEDPYTISND